MGRAKRLGAATSTGGLAIEYVRTRKVVRLLGWLNGESIQPVEIPVGELCDRLGIDPRELVAPQRYLLFAGSHRRPQGGRRDLLATFASEEKAWAAFGELRRSHPADQRWAELAVIDGSGQITQLAWFGVHHGRDSAEEAPTGSDDPGTSRIPQRRHLTVADQAPTYLRAVTPS